MRGNKEYMSYNYIRSTNIIEVFGQKTFDALIKDGFFVGKYFDKVILNDVWKIWEKDYQTLFSSTDHINAEIIYDNIVGFSDINNVLTVSGERGLLNLFLQNYFKGRQFKRIYLVNTDIRKTEKQILEMYAEEVLTRNITFSKEEPKYSLSITYQDNGGVMWDYYKYLGNELLESVTFYYERQLISTYIKKDWNRTQGFYDTRKGSSKEVSKYEYDLAVRRADKFKEGQKQVQPQEKWSKYFQQKNHTQNLLKAWNNGNIGAHSVLKVNTGHNSIKIEPNFFIDKSVWQEISRSEFETAVAPVYKDIVEAHEA